MDIQFILLLKFIDISIFSIVHLTLNIYSFTYIQLCEKFQELEQLGLQFFFNVMNQYLIITIISTEMTL